jgi:hypothetical protein
VTFGPGNIVFETDRLLKEQDLKAWQKLAPMNAAVLLEFLHDKRFNEPFETWTAEDIINRLLVTPNE